MRIPLLAATSFLCTLLCVEPAAQAAVPTAITDVPFVISKPGRYVLTRSRPYAGTGFAITINADDVVLDLQDWTLSTGVPNPALQTGGIYAIGRKNLTIRNGTLRGFFRGVSLAGAASAGNLIENVRVDAGTFAGVQVYGNASVVRRCRVANIAGSTVFTAYRVGIEVSGSGVRLLDNDVSNVFASETNSESHAYGIHVLDGSSSVIISGNRILNDKVFSVFDVGSAGIQLTNSNFCMISENQISQFGTGLFIQNGAQNIYRDNTVTRTGFSYNVTPASAGKDGGGNVAP